MLSGCATHDGTLKFKSRFKQVDADFFSISDDLHFSSIGLGSALGSPDIFTDINYSVALKNAVTHGINVIDTALCYRSQRSEKIIGKTLHNLCSQYGFSRNEFIISSKGNSIEDLDNSLKNLRLECLDIYYLHNPEDFSLIDYNNSFIEYFACIFLKLEEAVQLGKIKRYGIATWDAFRVNRNHQKYLSLNELVNIAYMVSRSSHNFRFIQMPFNLGMLEALTNYEQFVFSQQCSPISAAKILGLNFIASAPLAHGHLINLLPPNLRKCFPLCNSNAHCALQFVRSVSGITSALVGMSRVNHVLHNVHLSKIPKLNRNCFECISIS